MLSNETLKQRHNLWLSQEHYKSQHGEWSLKGVSSFRLIYNEMFYSFPIDVGGN